MSGTEAIWVPIVASAAGGLMSSALRGGGSGGGGGGGMNIPGSSSAVGGGENPFLQALAQSTGNAAAMLSAKGLSSIMGRPSVSTPPFVPPPPPLMSPMTPPFSGQTPSYWPQPYPQSNQYAPYDPTLAQLFQSFQD